MASLTDILSMLYAQAELHPGEPQRHQLGRGLRLDVKREKNLVLLQISRIDTWPADQEMQTVLGHWAWPKPPAPPAIARRFYVGRYYILTSWPVPVRLFES